MFPRNNINYHYHNNVPFFADQCHNSSIRTTLLTIYHAEFQTSTADLINAIKHNATPHICNVQNYETYVIYPLNNRCFVGRGAS
jgi:hypothetical protein